MKPSFTDTFLRSYYDDTSELMRLAMFNWFAHWEKMRAYSTSLEPGDLSARDTANDYSPEPFE